MNRLTRKHKPTNYTRYTEKTICLKNYNIRSANLNKAIEKLGKFEDLQEELDCPLEVVFKVLLKKEGIRTIKNNTYYINNIVRLSTGNLAFALESAHYLHLKDYQKTWWLKGEKENV